MIPSDQLKTKYEKYDLPNAKKLMSAAGSKGFDVTLTTFSTLSVQLLALAPAESVAYAVGSVVLGYLAFDAGKRV